MYDPQVEAESLADALRERASAVPPERRLRVPGAAREVLGLHKHDLLAAVGGWLGDNRNLSDQAIFDTCRALWAGRSREEQFVSTRILARRPSALRPQPWNRVGAWLEDVDSVEGADALAIHVLGPWTVHDVRNRLSHLRSLLAPADLVGRRVALVATTAMRAEAEYPEVAQEFVRAVLADREPLIVDAAVWALCALSRHHRSLVEAFLEEHGELDRLGREQVENWLRTGSRTGLVDREWRLPKS